MDQNRVDDDVLLRTAVERLVGVEPSAGFPAGVRERVATERIAGRAHLPVRWSLAAAAMVVVAAGVLLVRTNQPRTVPIPATSQTLPAAAEAGSVTNTVTAAGRQSPTIPAIPNRRPVATGTNRAGPITPEPVIPRQEITAVRQLIAVAQEGRFAYQPVGEALPVESDITPPEIVVSPIALLPLGDAETFE